MTEEKQKYRITFKCSCGSVFKKITTNANLKVTACPECKKKDKKTKFVKVGDGPVSNADIIAEQAAIKLRNDPDYQAWLKERKSKQWGASVETKNLNKAIDVTADIVMKDYKMGDLKDNVRVGETMAPKLDPRLQASADGMFGQKNNRKAPFNAAALARKAMSGALRDTRADPVRMLHQAESRGRA